MSFGTQVDQDDCKTVVEQFVDRVKAVQDKLNKQVKTKKAKLSKLYKTAHLQSNMVFDLDNKSIPEIDALSFALQGGLSIALNPLAWIAANKKKHKRLVVAEKVLKDFLLMANSFRNSIKKLTQALMLSNAPSTSASTIPKPLFI